MIIYYILDDLCLVYCWNNVTLFWIIIVLGDCIMLYIVDFSGFQVWLEWMVVEFKKCFDLFKVYVFIGLVVIVGVELGDWLEIKIEFYEYCGWVWISLIFGFGLLVDDFLENYLFIWKLDCGQMCFMYGIMFDFYFFVGIIGVQCVEFGEFCICVLGLFGGNMDVWYFIVGMMLYFFVLIFGVNFFVGDCYVV